MPSHAALCVAALCGLVGGINHLTRDFLAALELQVETDLGIREDQYHLLNVCYFAPNMVLPLVWGCLAQMLGPARTQVGAATISAIGNACFLIGVFIGHGGGFGWLLAGRLLMGMAYEGLDAMWCSLVTPLVKESAFATIASLINASQRAGSAAAFLCAPPLYAASGLVHAMLLPSALGVAIVAPALLALRSAPTAKAASVSNDGELEPQALMAEMESSVAEASEVLATGAAKAKLRRARLSYLYGCGFSTRYWLFVLCATLLYASVVPFWFIGSKLLQRPPWSIPLHHADEVSPPPQPR